MGVGWDGESVVVAMAVVGVVAVAVGDSVAVVAVVMGALVAWVVARGGTSGYREYASASSAERINFFISDII